MSADRPPPPPQPGLTELETRLRVAEKAMRKWEVEAVMRATTVAGTLTMQILASQRLALAAERLLTSPTPQRSDELEALRRALGLYREIQRERPQT